MLPLKDNVRARGFPIVTAVLIGVNLLVFLIELSLPPQAREGFIGLLGVVPGRLLSDPGPGEWMTLVTSQFLHGGWLHLGSNLLALYIFGDNVEDRFGPWRFLGFYLVCGVVAAITHTSFAPNSMVPSIGASGAISGVMAAYVALFPTAQVFTLVPIIFIPWFVEVPALLWIGVWFVTQVLSGLLTLSAGMEAFGGIAWWAHVGGFAAGLVLVLPLRRSPPSFHLDEAWPW